MSVLPSGTVKSIPTSTYERYEKGSRVLYTALFNNPGHEKPGDKIPGIVIAVFGKSPVYRIELDTVWGERMTRVHGEKIVVGNVSGRSLMKTTP